MTEPISMFILTTAAGVLSEIIKDMIRGGAKATKEKEIEKEISKRLMQREDVSSRQMREMLREVMKEVKFLASKDPTLSISGEGVGLVKSIRSKMPFGRREKVERALAERLKRLEEAVTARRRQLGLPLHPSEVDAGPQAQEHADRSAEPAAGLVTSSERDLDPFEWETPARQLPRSEWREQMRITEYRVRRRRRGEKIDD